MSTDPIEITRLYVLERTLPSLDDYNLHIRPNDAEPLFRRIQYDSLYD